MKPVYEYNTCDIQSSNPSDGLISLNKLGLEGWQVCAKFEMAQTSHDPFARHYFIRFLLLRAVATEAPVLPVDPDAPKADELVSALETALDCDDLTSVGRNRLGWLRDRIEEGGLR